MGGIHPLEVDLLAEEDGVPVFHGDGPLHLHRPLTAVGKIQSGQGQTVVGVLGVQRQGAAHRGGAVRRLDHPDLNLRRLVEEGPSCVFAGVNMGDKQPGDPVVDPALLHLHGVGRLGDYVGAAGKEQVVVAAIQGIGQLPPGPIYVRGKGVGRQPASPAKGGQHQQQESPPQRFQPPADGCIHLMSGAEVLGAVGAEGGFRWKGRAAVRAA